MDGERQVISAVSPRRPFDVLRRYSWEWILVLILAAVAVISGFLSPYFWDGAALMEAPAKFLDKAFLALPMAMIICLGMIDISVGSTVALCSVLMAMAYNAGLPMPLAVVLCLVIGLVCGMINGLILVKFHELAAMIVTLSTMIVYRGIAYILLEDQSAGKFPDWFGYLAWGTVGPLPVILVCFVLVAAVFVFVMHGTAFGRRIYAIGLNPVASRFSGIHVNRYIFIAFTLAGLMAGVTALFLTSRMGSTRPNVALSYELDAITMVVLGGFSTSGGKGRMGGLLLSVLIIGYLRHGLGLININAQILMIVIGALLVLAVMAPDVTGKIRAKFNKGV